MRAQVRAIGNAADAAKTRGGFDDLTTTPYPKDNLTSVFDLVQRSIRLYKDRPCLGTRAYLGTQKADPSVPPPFPHLDCEISLHDV